MYSGTYSIRDFERDLSIRRAKNAAAMRRQKLREIVAEIQLRTGDAHVQCNCDLDNWEPTDDTGHSPVCRIHKLAMAYRS